MYAIPVRLPPASTGRGLSRRVDAALNNLNKRDILALAKRAIAAPAVEKGSLIKTSVSLSGAAHDKLLAAGEVGGASAQLLIRQMDTEGLL